MGKIRRCNNKCHSARGTRCSCWCSGFFHGVNGTGSVNRAALLGGMIGLEKMPGFKVGGTAYIQQTKLPME